MIMYDLNSHSSSIERDDKSSIELKGVRNHETSLLDTIMIL